MAAVKKAGKPPRLLGKPRSIKESSLQDVMAGPDGVIRGKVGSPGTVSVARTKRTLRASTKVDGPGRFTLRVRSRRGPGRTASLRLKYLPGFGCKAKKRKLTVRVG